MMCFDKFSAGHCAAVFALFLMCLFLSTPTANAILLYDVDFGTPPHQVGQPPATGTGDPPRNVPTEIVFGDPLVVAALGALTDQPCAFGNGTTGYDQLRFTTGTGIPGGFPAAYGNYYIVMDVLVVPPASTTGVIFTIFLDSPTVRRVDFMGDGNISLYPGSTVIGSYTLGVPVQVEINADVVMDFWTIKLDEMEVHSAAMDFDQLRSVRLQHWGANANDYSAVDNFLIFGDEIPVAVDNASWGWIKNLYR